MFEFMIVFIVGLLVCVIGSYVDLGINIFLVVLFLVIVFVSGFVLMMGLVELFFCNMVLGIVCMMDVVM